MKTIQTFLGLLIISAAAHAAAPAVGSVAVNQNFARARETSAAFDAASLNDYEGKILILMMMTPWCPNCQSNAQAVGRGLLAHFNNPSRASLRGRNDNGVPIESILLSTEEADTWDGVNKSFSTTNGFSQWGLDADTQRQKPRQLLGYFRGGFINSSNLYDWGNDRRRLVVLNLVEGSASHSFREIIINTNSYTSSNDTAARAAINRILAASSGEPKPEIEVHQPATSKLTDGRSKRSFGAAKRGRKGRTLTFRVTNTGDAVLDDLSLTKAGKHPQDFIISNLKLSQLAPRASTSFKVTFTPRGTGSRSTTLRLASNDADESPFDINLTGRGAR